MFGTGSSTKDTISTLNSVSKNKSKMGMPKSIYFKTKNPNEAYKFGNWDDLNVL